MLPNGVIQAMGMVLLAWGAFGASNVAMEFNQPFFALGYILAGLALLVGSVRSLVRMF